ncbi:MAG: pantoate--beta-alanine ligase [Opitutales bacterium]
MEILETPVALQTWRSRLDPEKTVGVVPTMGALHAGHRSLIRAAREACDIVVVTLFVNPTQFNQAADLKTYPQPWKDDLAACRAEGADAVFRPDYADLYPDDYAYRVSESRDSLDREGTHRPGHFDGVLTVVLKLFQLVRPDQTFFGEKDRQQLELVRGMIRAFFLPIQLVACPTVRDADGLALSSRNRRLSPEARKRAAAFPRILRAADTAEEAAAALAEAGFTVDYVEDRHGRRFGAVNLEGIRLIDNLLLQPAPVA